MDMKKPPLGAKPYYIVASDRIEDLARAIYDYSQEFDKTDLIKKWVNEIIYQCETMEKIKATEQF